MKRLLTLLLAFLCTFAYAQGDFSALDAKLEEYFQALEGESTPVKQQECDFLISSCKTESMRDHVAKKLYAHFVGSKLMGDEAVAIYLTDNWFTPGKASLGSELELMNAKIFADFNRSSLLGLEAPSLLLQTPQGEWQDALPGDGRQKILFFHDTSCATCKIQNALLKGFFARDACRLDFISVYCGTEPEAWASYREEIPATSNIRVFHYWDPDIESDYQLKYGVMSTPKMFLIDSEGIIVGRELDVLALEKLLAARQAAFKEVTAEMLYALWESPDEQSRLSAGYVADSLILSRPDVWNTREDSLKVVGLAEMVKDLLSRAAIGSRIPSIKVPGTLVRKCGSRSVVRRLDRLRKGTYIVFYSPTCSTCKGVLESLKPQDGNRYYLIDTDALEEDLRIQLLDSFDLSVLPHVILLGRRGEVLRKYIAL